MKPPSKPDDTGPSLRDKIIGLGERSIRKSYYPQLQRQLDDLKEARSRLADSEAGYRSLVENINDVIFSLDLKGTVTYISPVVQNFGGLTPEQVVGVPFREFVHPDDQSAVATAFERVLAGHREPLEFRVIDKQGKLYHVRTSSRPLVEKGRVAGLTGVISDISARKAAENELRELNNDFVTLLENTGDFIYFKDRDNRFRFCSQTMANITGHRSWRDMIGKDDFEVFPEETARIYREEELPIFKEGKPLLNKVDPYFDVQGERRWVNTNKWPVFDEKGAVVGIFGISRDVTELKVAEEKLNELNRDLEQRVQERTRELAASEERMRLFFERQLVGMAITSPEKGWIQVNDKICEMMGYSREELLRLSWAEMTYPEDLAADVTQFERLLRGEIDNYVLEKRFVRKDGRIVFTNLAVGCVRREDRSVDYVLALLEDITERKHAEENIHELNVELQQRAKALEDANKELESFSYSVSHDLRTPLRAIDGFSHILLEDYAGKLDDEGKRLLNVVRDNANRMGQLIDDILKFSRSGRTEITFSRIDMEKMAHSVAAELMAPDLGGKLQMEIEPIPPAQGDSAMMHQVFVNLISNAIKFSRRNATPKIHIGATVTENETIYFVKDDGVGFDMQYANKLFGVFQRLHSVDEFEGTGIGLAIVKRIVMRHGGRVWAEGKVNEGATIFFSIPTRALPQMEAS